MSRNGRNDNSNNVSNNNDNRNNKKSAAAGETSEKDSEKAPLYTYPTFARKINCRHRKSAKTSFFGNSTNYEVLQDNSTWREPLLEVDEDQDQEEEGEDEEDEEEEEEQEEEGNEEQQEKITSQLLALAACQQNDEEKKKKRQDDLACGFSLLSSPFFSYFPQSSLQPFLSDSAALSQSLADCLARTEKNCGLATKDREEGDGQDVHALLAESYRQKQEEQSSIFDTSHFPLDTCQVFQEKLRKYDSFEENAQTDIQTDQETEVYLGDLKFLRIAKIAESACAFLNSPRGGSYYIGLGKKDFSECNFVRGIVLSTDKRDNFRMALVREFKKEFDNKVFPEKDFEILFHKVKTNQEGEKGEEEKKEEETLCVENVQKDNSETFSMFWEFCADTDSDKTSPPSSGYRKKTVVANPRDNLFVLEIRFKPCSVDNGSFFYTTESVFVRQGSKNKRLSANDIHTRIVTAKEKQWIEIVDLYRKKNQAVK